MNKSESKYASTSRRREFVTNNIQKLICTVSLLTMTAVFLGTFIPSPPIYTRTFYFYMSDDSDSNTEKDKIRNKYVLEKCDMDLTLGTRKEAIWHRVENTGVTLLNVFHELRRPHTLTISFYGLIHFTSHLKKKYKCAYNNATGIMMENASLWQYHFNDRLDMMGFVLFKCHFNRVKTINRNDTFQLSVQGEMSRKYPPQQRFCQTPLPVPKQFELIMCAHKATTFRNSKGAYSWIRVAAFIEHHLANGFSHVVLYHASWPAKTEAVVRRYEGLGLVTVVEWPGREEPLKFRTSPGREPLAMSSPTSKLWFHAQWAVVHDCLYRMSGRAKYIAFLDVDEFLFPVKPGVSIIDYIRSVDRPWRGSFLFRHSYFALENHGGRLPDLPLAELTGRVGSFHNYSKYAFRSTTILPEPRRSKLIVKPEAVDILQLHNVHKFCEGWRRFTVHIEDFVVINQRDNRRAVKHCESVHDRIRNTTFVPQDKDYFATIQRNLEQGVRAHLHGFV